MTNLAAGTKKLAGASFAEHHDSQNKTVTTIIASTTRLKIIVSTCFSSGALINAVSIPTIGILLYRRVREYRLFTLT